MDDAIARVRASAREALAEYHLGIVNGGEPVYPQWAKDCMDALHETDRRIAALREDYLDMERKAVALTVKNVELSEQRGGDPLGLQAVAEKMYKSLCEELAAYDPPIHHVREAVQAYQDWVNFTAPSVSMSIKQQINHEWARKLATSPPAHQAGGDQ